jgi:hypothetical protein
LPPSTRYDISYAVGVLARFSANPVLKHWKAAKHLLRYLKGTIDFRLEYGPDPSSTELFTTFSDADFGGNKDTGKSTGGYMVRFGTGAVSWQSKLQPFVVLSTTEAEFISCSCALLEQEHICLRYPALKLSAKFCIILFIHKKPPSHVTYIPLRLTQVHQERMLTFSSSFCRAKVIRFRCTYN